MLRSLPHQFVTRRPGGAGAAGHGGQGEGHARSPCCITGESGTGKEVLARYIHYHRRAQGRHLRRPSTAPRSARASSSASSSATSGARSPARWSGSGASSSWPTAGRSSWTRSATCPWRSRPSSCASSRSPASSGWAGSRASAWTRGSSRRRTRTSPALHPARGSSARTSSTASTWCPSTCPPCGSGAGTSLLLVEHFLAKYSERYTRAARQPQPPDDGGPAGVGLAGKRAGAGEHGEPDRAARGEELPARPARPAALQGSSRGGARPVTGQERFPEGRPGGGDPLSTSGG